MTPARTRAALEARFAEYCRLRDAGSSPSDARDEVGIGQSAAGKYERAWKRSRGFPLGKPSTAFGER